MKIYIQLNFAKSYSLDIIDIQFHYYCVILYIMLKSICLSKGKPSDSLFFALIQFNLSQTPIKCGF